jgi:hypothetical protein
VQILSPAAPSLTLRDPNYDKIPAMFRTPVARLSAITALLTSAMPVSAQRAVVHEKDIVNAIVEQFDRSDLVGLGELHGSRADQDLRFQIIHSQEFARKVHIIVVEGLNALYQEDLDRYIRGEDVPKEQVQKVWRDSTGIFVGPVMLTVYEQFLSAVRSVNRSLPEPLRLRVIAADPPLDWARVQSAEEFRSILGKRLDFGAEVIEREVLRKQKKALLIFANAWFTRNQQRKTPEGFAPRETIGSVLDKDFPDRLFVITPVRGGVDADTRNIEKLIGTRELPVLLRLKGSVFGALDANQFVPDPGLLLGAPPTPFRRYRDGATMAEVADACIYSGHAADVLVRPDPSYANDAAYQAELKRRAGFAPSRPPGR